MTFEALRWCQGLGIGVVMLGRDGMPMLTSTPRMTDDARLRRVPALAPYEPVGLGVARYLLSAKVAGQAHPVSVSFGDLSGAATIAGLEEAVMGAETVEDARQLEASAAAVYFGAWTGRRETVPALAAKDRSLVPAHRDTFAGRRSVLASSASNRKAERPVSTLLNYIFALLEAEAVLACAAVGLDPWARFCAQRRQGS